MDIVWVFRKGSEVVGGGSTRGLSPMGKGFTLSAVLVVGVSFVGYLGLALFVPIYTDEVSWKISSARFFAEKASTIASSSPQCFSDFGRFTYPITFWLGRAFESLLYSNLSPPLVLRWIGMLHFLFLLLLWQWCLKESQALPSTFNTLRYRFLVVLPLSMVGVLPFLLSFNRPEMPLVLGLTVVAALCLRAEKEAPRTGSQRDWLSGTTQMVVVLVPLILLVFSGHPKTVFFAPTFLVAILSLVRPFWPRVLLVSLLVLCAVNLFLFSRAYYQCPLDPQIDHTIKMYALQPAILWTNPKLFFSTLKYNYGNAHVYLHGLVLKPRFMSSWLPPPPRQVHLMIQASASVVCFLVELMGAWVVFSLAHGWWHRRRSVTSTRYLMSALLVGSVAVMGIQTIKCEYESTLFIPVLFLLVLLGIRTFNVKLSRFQVVFSIGVLSGVGVFCLISTFLAFRSSLPYWAQAQGKWMEENQPNSISGYHWSQTLEKMRALARECHLKDSPDLKHLVVDDLTYFAFEKTRFPFHALYLSGWQPVEKRDLRWVALLRRAESDGVIVRCRYLPPALFERAVKKDFLCCLPSFRLRRQRQDGESTYNGPSSRAPWSLLSR